MLFFNVKSYRKDRFPWWLVERRAQHSDDPRFEPRQKHNQNVWVFPSQKCCAESLSVCPTPVCLYIYSRIRKINVVLNRCRCAQPPCVYIIIYSRIRKITYARNRSCSPRQSSVGYGNAKRPSMHMQKDHALMYSKCNGRVECHL